MKLSTTLAIFSLAAAVSAHELPSRYFRARRGSQFVGGACSKDSDCQQGCCAFNTAKCAGPAFAQEQFGGCGHGNKSPNCNVAAVLGLDKDDCVKNAVNGDLSDPVIQAAAAFVSKLDNIPLPKSSSSSKSTSGTTPKAQNNASSSKGNVGCDTKDDEVLTCKKPSGTSDAVFAMATSRTSLRFVTQTCTVDSDCKQSCCAFNTGKCAGPGIAQTRDGGCGHGNAKPNCNVATALNLGVCAKGAQNGDVTSSEVQSAAAFVSLIDKLPFTPKAGGSTTKSSKTPTPTKSNNASNNGGSSGKNVGCDTNDDEALPCKKPSGTSDAVFALATSRTALKFVTQTCKVDSDCKQSCCGFNTGKCAGPAFAQESFGGCGHGNAKPNCNVAAALKLDDCVKGAQNGDLSSSEVQSASAFVSIIDKLKFTPTS